MYIGFRALDYNESSCGRMSRALGHTKRVSVRGCFGHWVTMRFRAQWGLRYWVTRRAEVKRQGV